jgi:hypothetical protein
LEYLDQYNRQLKKQSDNPPPPAHIAHIPNLLGVSWFHDYFDFLKKIGVFNRYWKHWINMDKSYLLQTCYI